MKTFSSCRFSDYRKDKKQVFFKRLNEKITIQSTLVQKKAEKNFSAFLFYTTLKGVCSKVEYYEPY